MNENREQREEQEKKERIGIFRRIRRRIVGWCKSFSNALRERTAEVKHAKAKRIAVFIGIGVFVSAFVLFYLTLGRMIAAFVRDSDAFKTWIEGFDEWSVLIFILLRVVQTVTKLIPGGPLEIASGFAFGTWGGFLWCMVGSFIGSVIILFIGKRYGVKLVGLFVAPERLRSASTMLDKKKRNFAFFLMYFLPGTPKDIFTWVVSVTDEDVWGFVLLTMLARIPSVLVSAWCGQELMDENYLLSILIFGVLIAGTILGAWIYKMIERRKTRGNNETEQTEEEGK